MNQPRRFAHKLLVAACVFACAAPLTETASASTPLTLIVPEPPRSSCSLRARSGAVTMVPEPPRLMRSTDFAWITILMAFVRRFRLFLLVRSNSVAVTIGGSGDATVWARDALSLNVLGSGDVHYYGDPKVSTTVLGSGRTNRLGAAPN